jgi:hypothetical protein
LGCALGGGRLLASKNAIFGSSWPRLCIVAQKLSKYKFEEAPMEVQLPEELSGTLRQLKPEGNLLKDRFKYGLCCRVPRRDEEK